MVLVHLHGIGAIWSSVVAMSEARYRDLPVLDEVHLAGCLGRGRFAREGDKLLAATEGPHQHTA